MVAAPVAPFRVQVPEEVLADLRARLERARLPNQVEGVGWEHGTELGYLRELVAHWRDGYDWRAEESRLNAIEQVVTEVDGQRIHLLHHRSPHPGALPIVLTHGWPGSVVEFLDVLGPLADPPDPADAFHVIVPSLPGYGFSGPTTAPGWHARRIARAFGEMVDALGYPRFGVQGGDWGSIVSQNMADLFPERVVGLHLNFVSLPPPKDLDPAELDDEAKAILEARRAWQAHETGYSTLQGTRPQTVGYALEDSPVGLLAYIVEKLRGWSDCGGDPETVFSRDRMLTNVMLYWVTATATSAARLYYEQRHAGAEAVPQQKVTVPTGVAVFPKEMGKTPRAWVERRYHVTHWSVMPRGGHFAAWEQPELFVEDVRAFFRPLRETGSGDVR